MWKPLQTIIVSARPLLGALVGVVPAHASPAAAADPPAAASAAKALAVFRSSCTSCHGPARQEGGLRLDTPAFIARSGTEAVVLAGRPDRSRLLARIEGRGGLPRMPLGFAPLAPEQVLAVRVWVAAGAPWPSAGGKPTHWAYRAPARPAPPKAPAGWAVRNPIDRFVWAKLRGARMRPSPEAPPHALVRRLYLDLIGLPPSPRQVDAYLADRRADRYERLVARLLASPHYGERWARPWLDLARYADTNGYEKDGRRSMWRYRDWVIDALNRDMPYDRFTLEQIAGDMLPGATASQRIATGFHCNTMLNEEGGVDPEEQRWLTLVDRVATTGTVWLGTTLACAQCHDHKYDPFTQRDYYRFLAFFERQAVGKERSPTVAQAARARQLDEALRRARQDAEAVSAGPAREAARARVAEAEKRSGGAEVDTTLVMAEAPGEGPPATFLRVRGSYLNRGERVTAGVPEVLPPLPSGAAPDRLALARWLVTPANPLTARVAVNRVWEQHFGRGIVATSDDFGTRGEPPTHPRLLDWLATELVRRHWSIKSIQRLIVTSSVYRQSSRLTPTLLATDPENRLLARGPRFRVPAETVRDITLAAAGLLDTTVGGPSVFPLQPEGTWVMPYNGDQWRVSDGGDRQRRGLYTFWRRTAPYPSFVAFDAPSREVCTARRARTTTPLQALTTMNDPAFFDAARALGRRMARKGGTGPAGRIAYGFRCCVARTPTRREADLLGRLYRSQLARFRADAAAARAVRGEPNGSVEPEAAALTMVANVLLNLDETLTRE